MSLTTTAMLFTVDQPHQIAGGTFARGGTTELWVNVTYNYSTIIGRVLEGGWRALHGKRIEETLNDPAQFLRIYSIETTP